MPRNVEIKARIASVEALLPCATTLADGPPVLIDQDDSFFACPNGRLKLRAFSADRGELIFYRRADAPGPKASHYVISPTASPDSLREALTLAYGNAGRVRKRRTLLRAGRTRIHLDRVEGLGDFIELEVVLAEGEPEAVGVEVAHALLAALGIAPGRLVAGAYVDLLTSARAETWPTRGDVARPTTADTTTNSAGSWSAARGALPSAPGPGCSGI